jgi:hypothetical protein
MSASNSSKIKHVIGAGSPIKKPERVNMTKVVKKMSPGKSQLSNLVFVAGTMAGVMFFRAEKPNKNGADAYVNDLTEALFEKEGLCEELNIVKVSQCIFLARHLLIITTYLPHFFYGFFSMFVAV